MSDYQKSCKDVFHAFLVENATYDGEDEMPWVTVSNMVPNKLVLFSEALRTTDYDQWVVFYEHDYQFERIWNNPKKYLKILKRFRGVISPDFSLYRRMPLCMQKWSAYKSRALAHWWSENGIEVIPNVRFADPRSYAFCFDGIPHNSTVCVGAHGCVKKLNERRYFEIGLAELVKRITPKTIVFYGAVPKSIINDLNDKGIEVLVFKSKCSESHSEVLQ
ncbi:MAG: DUF4417 domain-containing protein [Erysipelotrichaceae bacterium]|nr:DUF4417 domain-containing protein [Erysipelotrichaceae bacterium]